MGLGKKKGKTNENLKCHGLIWCFEALFPLCKGQLSISAFRVNGQRT